MNGAMDSGMDGRCRPDDDLPRRLTGVWIPRGVLLARDLTPLHRFLLAEIDSLDLPDKGCTASNRHFENLFQVSNATVTRAISHLENLGFIAVHRRSNQLRSIRSKIEFTSAEPDTGEQAQLDFWESPRQFDGPPPQVAEANERTRREHSLSAVGRDEAAAPAEAGAGPGRETGLPPPDPAGEIRKLFQESYRGRLGAGYAWSRPDSRRLKHDLQDVSAETLAEAIRAFFDGRVPKVESFVRERASYAYGVFRSQLPKLLEALPRAARPAKPKPACPYCRAHAIWDMSEPEDPHAALCGACRRWVGGTRTGQAFAPGGPGGGARASPRGRREVEYVTTGGTDEWTTNRLRPAVG